MAGAVSRDPGRGGHVEIVQSRIAQGDLIAVAAGTLGLNAGGRIDGELQMTVAGIERVIPALGIDKMLEDGVPQATLDRVAPGVKMQDLNNLMGALNRAVPGLGNVVRQNANVGVAAGINALGREAVLEGRKARAFPLRFVDGAVLLWAQSRWDRCRRCFETRHCERSEAIQRKGLDCFVACAPRNDESACSSRQTVIGMLGMSGRKTRSCSPTARVSGR